MNACETCQDRERKLIPVFDMAFRPRCENGGESMGESEKKRVFTRCEWFNRIEGCRKNPANEIKYAWQVGCYDQSGRMEAVK